MRNMRSICLIALLLITLCSNSLWAYKRVDPGLIPALADRLVPFAPLSDYMTIYLPSSYSQLSQETWDFKLPDNRGAIMSRIHAGEGYRSFDSFVLSFVQPDSQLRIIGPIGFPDKFDDRRERYIAHFIKDGRMLTGIYGSVIDEKKGRRLNIECIFPTDYLDYFEALTYAIICSANIPAEQAPLEIDTWQRWVTVYECYALQVPLAQSTPEDAVSAFYATLITNRWGKSRKFLHPEVDVWPPPFDVLYRERAWWAVKWFKILYQSIYADRVSCAVMKGVLQNREEQSGVDYVDVRKHKDKWYITTLE